jgi:hypothetical protein
VLNIFASCKSVPSKRLLLIIEHTHQRQNSLRDGALEEKDEDLRSSQIVDAVRPAGI